METEQAQQIIRALAQGIDPHTGETYSGDSPYQHPQTVRALYIALDALQQGRKVKKLPENAGKPWSPHEDAELAREFDAGKSIDGLASLHLRTPWAVKTRLVKLGKLEAEGLKQRGQP